MAKNSLVVCYSWGGNTKAVAEYIADKIGADLLELKVKNPYPADYDACVSQVGQDGKSYEPELSIQIPDLAAYAYDVVFAGSPCWWGTIANPMRTFLRQNDFAGKTVIPFMTHGTSGLHVQDVKKLCPDSYVLRGCGIFNQYQVSTKINTPANMGNYKKEIDRWLKELRPVLSAKGAEKSYGSV